MGASWDRRSPAEQARLEGAVLSRWLVGVLAAAPFHADRAGDIDPRLLTDRRGLRRLAPTRERELLADAPGGASAVLRPTEAQIKATADDGVIRSIARGIRRDGSRGKRDAMVRAYRPLQLHRGGVDGELLVASSRDDLDRLHRTGARAAAVLGLRDDDVVLSAVPAGPTLASLGTIHLAAGAGLTALHARGAGDGLDAVVHAAATVPATVVVVPVAEAAQLAITAVSDRVDLRGVRTVVTVGVPPSDGERDAIAAAYRRAGADVLVRALWGPSSGRALWAECAEGTHGLHTYPDLEVLEVLDPLTGTPSDGDGDLTLTSSGWHGTALVRFQTGAWIDPLATEPCPGCRRTVPRIVGEVAAHAWELPVTLDAGQRGGVDLRGVAAVVAATPWVRAWRAELRGPTDRVPRDRLVVELAGGETGGGDEHLERLLELATGVAPQLLTGIPEAEIARGIEDAGGILADRR